MNGMEKISIDTLGDWKRTHDCGSLRPEHIGEEALLMGWVNTRRDLGGLIFIDLRDREGLTQIVFDPQLEGTSHRRAHILRNEWVIAVKGDVVPRIEGQENPNLPTGAVELRVRELKILNRTETPPFQVDGQVDGSEALRLKYRYLELRRNRVFETFRKRHLMAACIRNTLNENGFIEVETPILTKSTPEGARDYLVPSRVNRGHFYALPQSPQLFKQLLMIGGFDRYYQIVRCFRDEDLRADRQPEFTQVDMEMAFTDEEGVMETVEVLIRALLRQVLDREIPLPIQRMEYKEAMERFGTDRPDLRFGLELKDISDMAGRSTFRVFRSTLESGGVVKAVNVKEGAGAFSRKTIDELARIAQEHGAKGLAWAKVTPEGWQSSLSKFFEKEDVNAVNTVMEARPGDLLLIVSDQWAPACQVLGALRLEVARRLGLASGPELSFLWVTRFPLLEFDEEEGRWAAVHHPFTAPLDEDLPALLDHPERVRARAYDIVLNGSEIGGGSVRIHNTDVQEKIFRHLGIPQEEAEAKFGFLLEALRYGAPPHAGIALGFDRLVALLTGVESIREVIAFPKTASATCPLTGAPSGVDGRQLKELGLKISDDQLSLF